ncbi:MAG TPA: undecaprenyl-diphosphate phosphatase [Bacteroidia bacterium]|jgi:undecaprenyl-diphosphatase|nr:undecaprenyl-diphosphate phosphatase [Bacteroidia bacterium]
MSILQVIILGIIEGITEFLPISSTGHMVVASSVMGIADDPFTKLFTVAIQLGAILAVVALYWKRFLQTWTFYKKLFVAFLPAAVLGLIFSKMIDKMLGYPLVVGCSILGGGIVLLFVDKWFTKTENSEDKEVTYPAALKIGFFQTISILIPGISRSAVTIIGGLAQKLNRKNAVEFSFFLAVPTMFAATGWKLFEYWHKFKKGEGPGLPEHGISMLLLGNAIAFVVALIAVKTFITFLTKHGFKAFGYYRILAGLAIIALVYSKYHITML